MPRKGYATDLTDAEYCELEPLLPVPTVAGRPRRHSLRELLNSIFYIVRSGCAWRLLSHEFRRGRWFTPSFGAGRSTALGAHGTNAPPLGGYTRLGPGSESPHGWDTGSCSCSGVVGGC